MALISGKFWATPESKNDFSVRPFVDQAIGTEVITL